MDFSNISYLLFDHDGVLVETEYWYFKATQRGLAHLGIDLPLAGYRQHLVDGASNWEVARQQGIAEKDISAARANRDRYYQEYLVNEDINIEGVEEVVTITVSYEYKPAELAIDALTVEPDLPAEVQEALSFYAIYRGYLIKKATSPSEAQHNARQAQIHLTMFNEALRRAQELKNKDKTERIRFIRAPYPFGPAR